GNFAKNIQQWHAYDQDGYSLPYKKVTKDCWKVRATGATSIIIKYNYFAAQLDAGACWLDEDQVYINPVHCCLYIPEKIHEQCILEFDVPAHFQYATSLIKLTDGTLKAHDYH